MARSARDLAFVLDAVVGPEPTDLSSLPLPEASWSRSLVDLHPPRRVAWSPTLGYAPDRPRGPRRVRGGGRPAGGARAPRSSSSTTVFAADPVDEWLTLVGVYCLRVARAVPRRPAVWDRVDPGLAALVEYAEVGGLGRPVRPRPRRLPPAATCRLVDLFHGARLLLTPTVAGQTPAGRRQGTIDGEPDANWVRYTYPFNMTRSPAGTVCAGFTADGMPVGLQVVGPQHADVAVLRGLALLEDAARPRPRRPVRSGLSAAC